MSLAPPHDELRHAGDWRLMAELRSRRSAPGARWRVPPGPDWRRCGRGLGRRSVGPSWSPPGRRAVRWRASSFLAGFGRATGSVRDWFGTPRRKPLTVIAFPRVSGRARRGRFGMGSVPEVRSAGGGKSR